MSSNDIRLRLVIRRHGLPEVKLVWPCTTSEDLTIANLLAQVNEVVTLENGEWGLEDYAIELASDQGPSFECLHFQPVGKVFKHDDQVLIRSLLTEDLRRRRISGRHQISPDGIRLVDGIPFGRRRAPRDRPVISLPPRKRARITYDSDEEEDSDRDDQDPGQLLLKGSGPDINVLGASAGLLNNGSDDEDEDEDYMSEPGSEDEDDLGQSKDEPDVEDSPDEDDSLEEEIRLLEADNNIIGEAESDENIASKGGIQEGPAQDVASGSHSQSSQPSLPAVTPIAIAALQSAFPLTPTATIGSTLEQHQTDIRRSYQELAAENEPTLTFDEVLDGFLANRFQTGPSPASPTFLHQPPNASARPLIQEVESEEPIVSVTNDSTSTAANANDANGDHVDTTVDAPSNGDGSESDDESSSSSESEDDGSSSDSESEDDDNAGPSRDSKSEDDGSSSDSESEDQNIDSSSENSGSASDSSSDNEDQPPSAPGLDRPQSENEDTNSSEDDSSDSESSSDSSQSHGGVRVNNAAKRTRAQSSDSSSDSSSDDSNSSDEESSDMSEDSDSASAPEEAPAMLKSAKTQSQPAQHQKKGQTSPLKAAKITSVPQEQTVGRGQGLSKTQKRNARRREAKRLRNLEESRPETRESQDPIPSELDLIARKQALLSAVTEGSTEPAQQHHHRDGGVSEEPQTKANTKTQPTPDDPVAQVPQNQDNNSSPGLERATSANDETGRRRMRVDMGAGRRLVFGALGLQNPKSKTDEEKLKENLMKDVRPLKNHRLDEPTEGHKDTADVESENDVEDWRNKITYRAVECCHHEIVLSEPPFPFVQRWDPQQQYSSMRKRKRGSQNFYQEDHYDDDDSYWHDGAEEEPVYARPSKKSKKSKKESQAMHKQQVLSNDQNDNIELNYDDIPANNADDSSQSADRDDLASLPEDVSVLPVLQVDEVKSGMVITWKHLHMSKATNWQPELRSMTGMVISMNDENVLHLILAKRDREHNEKVYDEETGQRIYDKFEVPDDSEDEEEREDKGFRDISWSDLTEPRIVQDEPFRNVPNTPQARKDVQAGMTERQQEVREGIEKDLMDIATNDEQRAPGSGSIPSGQNHSHVTISAPSVEGLSNSEGSRAETSQGQSVVSAEVAIKDSQLVRRQDREDSEETSLFVTDTFSSINWAPQVSEDESVVNATWEDFIQEVQSAGGRPPSSELGSDKQVPSTGGRPLSPELGSDKQVPSAGGRPPSPELGSDRQVPWAGGRLPSPELGSDKRQTPVVDYPQLPVPSSATSIRSGRQPQFDNELMDYMNTADDAIVSDVNLPEHGLRPHSELNHFPEDDISERSSSPLPTPDELWHTAQTSKRTQSSPKSSQMSALRQRENKANREYEKAMQQIDDDDDPDTSPDKNKSIWSLFPNATQPSPAMKFQQKSDSEDPGSRPLRRSQRRSSSFQVPEGTQVINISSSPCSSLPAEHYADSSIDGTYEGEDSIDETHGEDSIDEDSIDENHREDEGSSLPNGSGWLKKNRKGMSGAATVKTEERRTGKTSSAAMAGTRSDNRKLPPSSSAGVIGQGSKQKKLKKKF